MGNTAGGLVAYRWIVILTGRPSFFFSTFVLSGSSRDYGSNCLFSSAGSCVASFLRFAFFRGLVAPATFTRRPDPSPPCFTAQLFTPQLFTPQLFTVEWFMPQASAGASEAARPIDQRSMATWQLCIFCITWVRDAVAPLWRYLSRYLSAKTYRSSSADGMVMFDNDMPGRYPAFHSVA